MAPRLKLQELLVNILGTNNVYFQPPPTIQMSYPCIVYNRSNIKADYAQNVPYKLDKRYTMTYIDPNPDSLIPDKLAWLPKCRFDRAFTAENLNHSVFSIYF